jgi:hypothetical protein
MKVCVNPLIGAEVDGSGHCGFGLPPCKIIHVSRGLQQNVQSAAKLSLR